MLHHLTADLIIIMLEVLLLRVTGSTISKMFKLVMVDGQKHTNLQTDGGFSCSSQFELESNKLHGTVLGQTPSCLI